MRLGVPGLVHGVVVDTAWFRGQLPAGDLGRGRLLASYPAPAELAALDWAPLVARTAAGGDTANHYPVDSARRWTHLRLWITQTAAWPDSGCTASRWPTRRS